MSAEDGSETPDDADSVEIEGTEVDPVPSQVVDDEVQISTGIETTDDGDVRVHRTAAFAELADRPKRKAIDQEGMKNDVKFFDDLRKFDAELAGTIYAQCQSAGAGVDVTHPKKSALDDDRTQLEKDITADCRELIRDIGMPEDIMTVFRNLIVHGNDVSWIEWERGSTDDDETTGGVTDLMALPLRLLTILDVNPRENQTAFGDYTSSDENYERTITDNDYYVIEEGQSDRVQVHPEREILHIALNKRGHWHKDHKGRFTFGVWGERRLEPVRYTLQAKQNTLANKVAMDDKLLAREYFHIKVEELFGHIEDPDRRQTKVEEYAAELRAKVEDLEADQKPILPEEVEVKVEGPDGDTARNMSDFIQTMNDSLQHALTYHVASFGRDAGGTDRGNRPAKEMSDNSVRHLREVVKNSFRDLFRIHAVLRYEDAREENGDYPITDIRRYELADDVTLPVLEFDPVDPSEQVEKVRNAISMYEKGIADLNEARVEAELEPLDPEDIEEMLWFRNPTVWEDDDEEETLYKNQQLPETPAHKKEMQEQQQEQEDDEEGPDGDERNPDTEGPGDEDQPDNSPSDDDDDDSGDSGGNRRTYPTDSEEGEPNIDPLGPYSTDPDDWEEVDDDDQ